MELLHYDYSCLFVRRLCLTAAPRRCSSGSDCTATRRPEVVAPSWLYSALPANGRWLHRRGCTLPCPPAGSDSFIATILSFARQLDLTAPPPLYSVIHADCAWLLHSSCSDLQARLKWLLHCGRTRQLDVAPPPRLYSALHAYRTRLPDQVLTSTPTECGCFTRLLALLTEQLWLFHHGYSALNAD
ncbi:hypothetical protein MHYP_G00071350 [Metynnis hypsauchen]